MADDSEVRGPIREYYSNLSIMEKFSWGFIAAIYFAALLISFSKLVANVLAGDIQIASAWAAIVSGLATFALVVVTGLYVVYTRNLVGVMEETRREERGQNARDSLIVQESEWTPHFFPTWGDFNIISCSGPKPWLPWLKAEVDGDQNNDWYEQNSFPVGESEPAEPTLTRLPDNVRNALRFYDIDWFIPYRDEIHEYFRENVTRETRGRLYFKFETMTGEWYFFVYHMDLGPDDDDGFDINAVPKVERYLPWEDSEERDQLEAELRREIEQGTAHYLHKPLNDRGANDLEGDDG